MPRLSLFFWAILCSVLIHLPFTSQALARDTIRIVGSSTVFPFSTVVAEHFADLGFRSPVVEATGTGGGMKLFCSGAGSNFPDIVNASRPMKKSELDICGANGIHAVTEVKIGYDGIVLVGSRKWPTFNLTPEYIFLALGSKVPQNGAWVNNFYKTWKQVDPSLPDSPVQVMGPPSSSGTRDAFIELAFEKGCKQVAKKAGLELPSKEFCKIIREDGAWVDAGEQDNLIIQKVSASNTLLGILGFDYYENNQERLKAATIEGVYPTFENIIGKQYPLSRPLYFYTKNQNIGVVKGLPEFVKEFMSERSSGDDGYLLDKGLIPLPPEERQGAIQKALSFEPFSPVQTEGH